MALRGLRTWKKALLLPWLVLYAILVALVMAVVLTGTFHAGFHWRYLLLGLCCLCFFSAWRQVRLQYTAMIFPRYSLLADFPWDASQFIRFRPSCCTVEDLATDLRAREPEQVVTESPANDLPPKYDDLDQPPKYEDQLNERNATANNYSS